FEFRAVGSSTSVSWPVTVINTIVAESLDVVATQLEKAMGKRPTEAKLLAAVGRLLKQIIKDHKRVIFNGDNYSAEWHAEAAERGLPNLATVADALPVLKLRRAVALFKKYKVLSPSELDSRLHIQLEAYIKRRQIESEEMVQIGRTMILPAALEYQRRLADTVVKTRAAGVECDADQEALESFVGLVQDFRAALSALEVANGHEDEPIKHARAIARKTFPLMEALRLATDALEGQIEHSLWPLPSYDELLSIR
ncbi:MAG: hypothetical protein KC468_01860, partial [Myxococcales bacterium]|nr:hypothetical protein [Myxococcales bacterium]